MSVKTKIRKMVREIESAQSQLEKGIAALYLSNGGSRYSTQEEWRMKKELTDKANAVLENVQEVIAEGSTEIKRLQAKTKLPVFVVMDSTELRQATLMFPFVKDDSENLPLAELAERVAAVAVHDDPVAMYLYHDYVARRLEAVRREMQRTVSTLDGQKNVGVNRHDPAHVTALSQAHKALRENLPLDFGAEIELEVESLQGSLTKLGKAKTSLAFAIGEASGLGDRVTESYRGRI